MYYLCLDCGNAGSFIVSQSFVATITMRNKKCDTTVECGECGSTNIKTIKEVKWNATKNV